MAFKPLQIIRLVLFAAVAIAIDFILFVFTNPCTACATFSQFISSSYSLFGPLWASLILMIKEIKIGSK